MNTGLVFENENPLISIIGLGYVGLPLAVEFGKKYKVIGFDINTNRVDELKKGIDRTLEVSKEEFTRAEGLNCTSMGGDLVGTDIFIITVPTPIDEYKRPDLTPLMKASEFVGKIMKPGAIVVYEPTVYPGCTEEECVPVLEKNSGLKFNVDFFCGYSPERVNPGDKVHRVSSIKKIVSGSTPEIGIYLNKIYGTIIQAGTHLAPSMKVAEAAKVIENTQRDINIAFVNELAKLFNLMGIDTLEVMEAVGTKWNALPFRPGLVGGHCIGIDPFYLTHAAAKLGYNPEIMLAGRRINDDMGVYVSNQFIKQMIKKEHKVNNSRVLILGITFKENCPDIRNSRVIDIIKELKEFGCIVDVYDPWADKKEVFKEYRLELISYLDEININNYQGIILAVAHNEFKTFFPPDFKKNGIAIYDVKGILDKNIVDARL